MKRAFKILLITAAILAAVTLRGVCKYRDALVDIKYMKDATDLNIVLMLRFYDFNRLDVFDRPGVVDFFISGLTF